MITATSAFTSAAAAGSPQWANNLLCIWVQRRTVVIWTLMGTALALLLCFVLPARYESSISFMPPEQSSPGLAMLAAITNRSTASPGLLNTLSSGLLSSRNNGELFMDLLHSGSVRGAIAERFHLQQVYRKRYMEDTIKKLSSRTSIVENKKSGVITITVTDTERLRAQEIATDYVYQLNSLLSRVSTSSARRERIFIEQRLAAVSSELQTAQEKLSAFSSSTAAIDIKEQTRATVDAGARLNAQLIVQQAQMQSLKQIYGDDNVRVRAAREQIAVLQREINKTSGSDAEVQDQDSPTRGLYPPLRRLPALGVRWANLYRQVRVQEAVYDLLSAEYETSRLQEAKEIPTVAVVDAAGWPEKRSFPRRKVLLFIGIVASFMTGCLFVLGRNSWFLRGPDDPFKQLLTHVKRDLSHHAWRTSRGSSI